MADDAQQAPEGPVLIFTDAAREKLREVFASQDAPGRGAIRVAIQGRGPNGFEYAMAVEEDGSQYPDDTVLDEGDFLVFVDPESLPKVRGATVDFADELMGGGFRMHNPNPVWDDPTAAGIQNLIDTVINPGVASHGGHVAMIDFKDDVVYVALGGGCQGCGMVDVTLRQGIEALIKQHYPQVVGVVDTTDHAGGTNPYYQPAKGADAGASPFYQPAKG
ncbi:MAG TPA: iron-sulfur cluster assembly accessory protein [Chloroflexota bacterium]